METVDDMGDGCAGSCCNGAEEVDGDLVKIQKEDVTTVIIGGSSRDGWIARVAGSGAKEGRGGV